jgi:23S rRNA pseudouridine1911/1915/1917 synthase
MRKIEFVVPDQYDGVTLKGFLRSYVGLSARQTAKLKRLQNGITRNGIKVIAPDLLHAGDCIQICFPDDEKIPEPVPCIVPVVYEDDDLLVVDKPASMPMYPCPGHNCDSLANAVAFHQGTTGEKYAFRPVYRLDRDTTGLVLITKNPFSAEKLSGKVRKTYFAVIEGVLTGSGIINRPIGLKPGHTIQRAVVSTGIPAITLWRAVRSLSGYSLVAVRLNTGRTHQIRVHFSSIGHPLAGDDMYGGKTDIISRQALHCAEIRFSHPITGKAMRFRSKFPDDMLACINNEK